MTHPDADAGAEERAVLGSRPMNRLFATYLLLSGLALVFPHRPSSWPIFAAAHLTLMAWALGLPPFGGLATRAFRRWPGPASFLADAYPLLVMPLLYAELAPLNLAVHGGVYFDERVLLWENAVFGMQPAVELWRAFPFLAVSEVMHGAYLSYYPLIYGPPLVLYLSGRYEAFREMIFTVMLTFFAHYLFFIFFPVQGPRYLFPAPDGALAEGILHQLTHRVLEAGSSQGAAFPSSHVGVAVVQAALAARYLPRLAPWLFVVAALLAIGTVYGGFHYAVDAIAGAILGLACFAVAPSLRRRLAGIRV